MSIVARKEPVQTVASDVLAGVLAYLGTDRFTGDTQKIHTVLARAQRHYPILSVFTFTSGDLYPFSRELEDALSILQRSRLIRMENPDYDTYFVPQGAQRSLVDLANKTFQPEEIQQLKDISEIFEVECGRIPSTTSQSEPKQAERVRS